VVYNVTSVISYFQCLWPKAQASLHCDGCRRIDISKVTFDVKLKEIQNVVYFQWRRPPLWSGGHTSLLQTQRFRIRLPALPDFMKSSKYGTGPTHPREDN
jgi:hypothetical protein